MSLTYAPPTASADSKHRHVPGLSGVMEPSAFWYYRRARGGPWQPAPGDYLLCGS